MSVSRYSANETERMRALAGVELAPFHRRAVAIGLDLVIGGLLFAALSLAILFIRTGTIASPGAAGAPGDISVSLDFFETWYGVLWWVVYFGLATYLGNGQTPGKRVAGIRVVSLIHERLSLWHSVERALGYGASALEFGFGFAQYFVHPNRRTVHDRIAETIVVTSRGRGEIGLAQPEARL